MQAKAAHALIAAVLAGLTLGTATPTLAGDKGAFKGHAVLIDTKGMEQKTGEGHPYKVLWMGEQEGAIFHNGGGGALDKALDRAHYLVQYVGDGGTVSGYCTKTFTTSQGDKLFARCDWKGNEKGSSGIVTVLGGTGRFAGIKGSGKFNFVRVSDKVAWDDIEWSWELP
jgi:hypothetical protein